MQMNPYLFFNGHCEEAFKFYEQCFGGKIQSITRYADSPAEQHVPPEWRDKIMHVSLLVGDTPLMGSDPPPAQREEPKGFFVSLGIKDPAEAERLFNALAEKGQVRMPFGKTFWATPFGMLVDQFGIPWMVNCE